MGRIGRIRFCGGVLGLAFALSLVHYLAAPWLARNAPDLAQAVFDYGFFFFLLLVSPLIIMRLHDLNSSGWWSLLLWVVWGAGHALPFGAGAELIALAMLLVLMLKAGNPDGNRFGRREPGHQP